MLVQISFLVLSLLLLYFGAEFALEGAEKIGKYFKLSPLVIGVVLIGFGTSLPEFFVSQISTFKGHPEMAIGNIIGSNIANVFLILGVSSFFTILHLNNKEIRSQLFIHIFLSIFLALVLWRKKIDMVSLSILTLFFCFSLFKTFYDLKKQQIKHEYDDVSFYTKDVLVLLLGFILLYFGGDLLVSSGSKVAELFGIKEYIISVIFVAFGTSFPELVTAMLACYKKKDVNLITGNILGSNTFNVAFVLGSLGIYDFEIEKIYTMEITILLSVSVLLYLFSFWPKKLNFISGIFFLTSYTLIIFQWINN